MSTIESLLDQLECGELIGRTVKLQDDEIERILDQRDSEAFSSQWMHAFREVESKKAACPPPPDVSELVRKLREIAYLESYERWKSSDLAAYISDDFGLIGDALALDVDIPWINHLLQRYLSGTVPTQDNYE